MAIMETRLTENAKHAVQVATLVMVELVAIVFHAKILFIFNQDNVWLNVLVIIFLIHCQDHACFVIALVLHVMEPQTQIV